MEKDTVLITGFAQLPKGTTLYEQYKTIAIVMVVNHKTEIIEDVEITFLTNVTNEYLKSLIKGYDLKNGLDPLLESIRTYCLLPSVSAIIQSIRSAYDRYQESKPIL